MDEVAIARGMYYVSLTVTGVAHGRMAETRRGTAMWDVAAWLHIEPEDLRDAIAEVYKPSVGKKANISHRVRLTVKRAEREHGPDGRFLTGR